MLLIFLSVAHIPPLSPGRTGSSERFPQTSTTSRNPDYKWFITWQLSWSLLGHLNIDQSRHVPHHDDGHSCHQCAEQAGLHGPRHLLQPAACAVQAVRLRLYVHQLGCLHKVVHIAMLSNERGVRGDSCPSIHHLPWALAWPEEARSDRKMGNRIDKLKQMRKIKTI